MYIRCTVELCHVLAKVGRGGGLIYLRDTTPVTTVPHRN